VPRSLQARRDVHWCVSGRAPPPARRRRRGRGHVPCQITRGGCWCRRTPPPPACSHGGRSVQAEPRRAARAAAAAAQTCDGREPATQPSPARTQPRRQP
jgi:hypothetical protein